jgi:hypothetical protein
MSRQLRKPYAECIVQQIQGRVKEGGKSDSFEFENLINLKPQDLLRWSLQCLLFSLNSIYIDYLLTRM